MGHRILSFLKEWTLPSAIVIGTGAYLLFAYVPALDAAGTLLGSWMDTIFAVGLFTTLFITFAKVDFREMRLARWYAYLIGTQLLLVGSIVGIVLGLNLQGTERVVAESVLTCAIAPCATASSVVTGKLGGNIHQMATFTLISSLLCSLTIPCVFPLLEKASDVDFTTASALILHRLAVVMLLPMGLGWVVRHFVPKVYRFIVRHPNMAFYCWGVTLAITTGVTVKNICHSGAGWVLVLIALLSLAVCVLHFRLGRWIGRHVGERINTGQGMFQKNTGLTILMSYLYLHPVASIGAGFYVIWQNIINSYELWEFSHKNREKSLTLQQN